MSFNIQEWSCIGGSESEVEVEINGRMYIAALTIDVNSQTPIYMSISKQSSKGTSTDYDNVDLKNINQAVDAEMYEYLLGEMISDGLQMINEFPDYRATVDAKKGANWTVTPIIKMVKSCQNELFPQCVSTEIEIHIQEGTPNEFVHNAVQLGKILIKQAIV